MRRSTPPRMKYGCVKGRRNIRLSRHISACRYGSRSVHYLRGNMFNVHCSYHCVMSSISHRFSRYVANLVCGKSRNTTIHTLQSRTTR